MALRVDLLLKITKVVITMITKRPCMPVAQINDLSWMTDRHSHALKIFIIVATRNYIALNNTVVLLSINYKTQYGNHYSDKETMSSSISYRREGHSNTHKILLGV